MLLSSWRPVLATGLLVACVQTESPHPAPVPPPADAGSPGASPAALLGEFEDDYGIRYTITPDLWTQHPGWRYHVQRWEPAGEYLIVHNDAANPTEGGLYSRIDWMELEGQGAYTLGFCLSAFDAPTPEAAEAVETARRDTPRTGCNGFPFSRLRPVD